MPTYIYGLRDSRSREIRYVGKSIDPRARRLGHIAQARNPNRDSYRLRWLRELLAENQEPELTILEEDPVDWKRAEQAWIKTLRSQGHDLTNVGDGGEGTLPGVRRSEATRQRMSKPKSPETRQRMSAASRLRAPISAATRAKMSVAAKNRTPEHRAAISKAKKGKLTGAANPNYGNTHTPEARASISEARKKKGATWKGGKHTPETRALLRQLAQNRTPEHNAKIAAGNRGKKLSPETKAKIAEAVRRSKARTNRPS